MASKSLRHFALNVLYIANEVPSYELAGMETTLKDIWSIYNQRVGEEAKLTFAQFKQYLKEAWEDGYIKLGGAYVKGVSEHTTGIPIEATIEIKEGKYSSYWSRIVNVKPSIEKIVSELETEAFSFVNQNIEDAFIRHQIHLLRMAGGMRNEIQALLDKTEKDLAEQIKKRLADHNGAASLGTRRLQLLEEYVKFIRHNAWTEVNEVWLKNLRELAKTEPKMISGLIQSSSPVALNFIIPDASLLQSLVKTNPFDGHVLKDWAKKIEEQDIQRIVAQIRIGMLNGESSDDIARRVVGSAKLKGSDGVTEITRRNAAAITRTAVMAISHAARSEFYETNSDLFQKERFVATLDSRTTPICRANDGKTFNIGTGPRPPLHFNCRSLRVPYFAEGVLGDRPARNFTNQQLLREFADEEDIPRVRNRADLPRGYKGSFDEFAQRRKREMTSIVPARTDFSTWLRRQTVEIQDDLLGPTRAKIFRAGRMTMDQFVDQAGRELTLAQLARQYAAIFRRAGLNPDDYL